MKTKLLVLVLGLQSAWFIGMVALQEFRLHNGQVVLLETFPVDPRDLLRGDYVTLNYKISSLPPSLLQGGITNGSREGTDVFVRLEKRGQFHEISSASLTALASEKDRPVLRGKVSTSWFWRGFDGTNETVHLEYGLERYYVLEGTGNPNGKLTVEAAVPSSGNAVIKQVFIDGKPYAEVMRNQAR